jgi:hypothetical protein
MCGSYWRFVARILVAVARVVARILVVVARVVVRILVVVARVVAGVVARSLITYKQQIESGSRSSIEYYVLLLRLLLRSTS